LRIDVNCRTIVAVAAMALSIPILARVGGISPAVAQTASASDNRIVTYDSNDRGWEINVKRSTNECSMIRQYSKGTFFMVGYRRRLGGYWLGMGRDDWADRIRDGATYTMNVTTDRMRWTGVFYGGSDGEYGTFHTDAGSGPLTKDFIVDLAMSNWIDFTINGRKVRRLSLDGSYDALMRLGACQRDMGW
jgi:hypothetical protein